MSKRGKTTATRLGGRTTEKQHSPEFLRALARRKAHIEEARHDVNNFIEYVFERPDGRPARQGRIHREWQQLADMHARLMIVAPRHHWKTGQAQGRTLFKLGRNVNELIKLLCQSDKKAIKRLSEIRTHLKDNDSLHRVFPHLHINRCVEINKHMVTFERQRRSLTVTIAAEVPVVVPLVEPGALEILGEFDELVVDELAVALDPVARRVQLAQRACAVTVPGEPCEQAGDGRGRLRAVQTVVTVRGRIQAGQDTHAAGRADGIVGVGVGEARPLGGQAVEIGRLNVRVIGATGSGPYRP